MKRIKSFFIVTLLICSSCFGLGAGFRFGANPSMNADIYNITANPTQGFSADLIGNIRLYRIPAQFGFGFQINQDELIFDYGICGDFDYLFVDLPIVYNWSFYAGAGVNSAILFNSKKDVILQSGTRYLVGYNWLWRDNYLELFTQVVCNPMVEFREFKPKLFKINVPFEVGFRVHF